MNNFNILDCADVGIDLWEHQQRFLTWLQDNYNNYDVFVCGMPVAAGKSQVAFATSNWISQNGLGKTTVICMNRMLQDQYGDTFKTLPVLKGADNYPCHTTDLKGTCGKTKRLSREYCDGGCGYKNALSRAMGSNTTILNPWNYEAFGENIKEFYRPNLIIDEAHGLVNYLFGSCEYKIWHHVAPWGENDNVQKTEVIVELLERMLKIYADKASIANLVKNDVAIKEAEEEISKLSRTLAALKTFGDDVLISQKRDTFYGKFDDDFHMKQDDYIHIKPKRVDQIAKRLWPAEIQKLILMSATIGPDVIGELGLQDKKIGYFECDSPIPKENRRCIYWPIADMSWKNRQESIPKIAAALIKTANRFPNDKGFVHATYDVAWKLKMALQDYPRFVFHDKRNKKDEYDRFRTTKEPIIMVGSGMSEGIDLANDAARWQVIAIIQYPSLQDEVNKWRMRAEKHKWLAEACRTVQQQYGRVCRTPQDTGITIIMDMQFWNLWSQTKQSGAWPKWFTEALEVPGK